MKKHYMIDIFKIIFAIGIVGLHTGFLLKYKYGYYLHTVIFRLGVPYFFIVSGYFLGIRINSQNRKEVIKQFIKKLLPVYLILGIIYAILGMIRFDSFNIYNILYNIWYLITGRSLSIMWYVGSLITSAIVLIHMNNKKNTKISIIVALLLYFIGLLFNTYAFLLKGSQLEQIVSFFTGTFSNNSNSLFCGYFYVGLGYYFARYSKEYLQKKINLKTIILIIMFFILLLETRFIRSKLDLITNYEYYVSHIIIVPLLFNISLIIEGNYNTIIIRQLSKYIYYFHYLVIYLFVFLNKYQNNEIINNSEKFFSYTLLITIIVSFIYINMKKIIKAKMLKQ